MGDPVSQWWRRNRWALLALPLVLALVAVTGASRLVNFWWPARLTEPIAATVGEPLTLTVDTWDLEGEPTSFPVTLVVGPTTQVGDVTDADGMMQLVPHVDGTRVWQTEVTITAATEHDPSGCYAEVVDSRGRTAMYSSTAVGVEGMSFTPCMPPRSSDDLFDDTWVRPETYTVPVLVRLTSDVEPTELRLYWDRPEYVSVPLSVTDGG